MASYTPSYKTIETCHYTKCHTNTKNAGTNQKFFSILRGNGVEAYKIQIYLLKILKTMICALIQGHYCDMQLVSNMKLIGWSDRVAKLRI